MILRWRCHLDSVKELHPSIVQHFKVGSAIPGSGRDFSFTIHNLHISGLSSSQYIETQNRV